MTPKISTYDPIDYRKLISKAKFGFLYDNAGNSGSCTRPYIVLDQHSKMEFVEIGLHRDGITIKAEGSMPNDWSINSETLTIDVNKLICNWLISMGEYNLINDL